ncbi:MAG: ATP-binding protein [Polyangiales bacterium]
MRRASSFAAERLVLDIEASTTTAFVQSAVRRWVRANGGDLRDEWCVAIAACEAATNIAKFAPRGLIALALAEPNVVELVAEDDGPGFDPTDALRDGVSEGVDLSKLESRIGRRGLGTGLGAIARQMDTLRISRREAGGTRLVATRALARRTR